MKIIDRYLIFTVIKATLFVLLALCALNLVFAFRGQADDIGDGNYGALQAIIYVALLIPQSVSLLLPIAALLGVLLGIGAMASSNELTVLRAAGMRPARIAASLVAAGILLAITGAIIHDQVAPKLAEKAYELRSTARAGGATIQGQVWLRHDNQFIYVRSVPAATELVGVRIYGNESQDDKTTTGNLNRVSRAERAQFSNGQWTLYNYAESYWNGSEVRTKRLATVTGLNGLQPEVLELFTLKTDALNIQGLYNYADYLKRNGIDATRYELAFWQRLARPFAVLIMVLLPLPFLFGSMRSMGAGQRTVIGVAIGIVFFVANEMLSNTGQIFGLNAFFAAWLPTLAFAALAFLGISRIR